MLRFRYNRDRVRFKLKSIRLSAEVLQVYHASSQKLRQLFRIILDNFTS